jgi:hypothetical protein
MDSVGGKKRGSEQVGRSRGGPTTKIHAVVDGLENPTKVVLTGRRTERPYDRALFRSSWRAFLRKDQAVPSRCHAT